MGLTTPGHGTQTFNYDDVDRLTQATGAYGTLTYRYDEFGNLLSNARVGRGPTPIPRVGPGVCAHMPSPKHGRERIFTPMMPMGI